MMSGETAPAIVYTLCLMTSAACAWLLGRTWRRTGTPLLFWSAICFALLAANNLVLILDMLIVKSVDLGLVRLSLSLGAVAVILFGFIWNGGGEE
jgi:hypothetical protein